MLGFRVYKYENILKNGKVFYFLPIPIDPRDIFQGRYQSLSFKREKIKSKISLKNLKYGDFIYVQIQKHNNETIIKDVFKSKPSNIDFLRVKFIRFDKDGYLVFKFLFNRFYMNEYKAKKVELLYNKLAKKDKILAKVRVLDGEAIIEDISIDSISINDFLDD